MLRVNFLNPALKAFKLLPVKHARQIAEKIELLKLNPHVLPIKELKGEEWFFRLRSGEYRVIYRIKDEELQIWLIWKRNDDAVYRKFQRMRQ